MTSVLLSSAVCGSSTWVFLKEGQVLRVEGMEAGDLIDVAFFPPGDELSIEADGIFPLPGVERIQVHHTLVCASRYDGGKLKKGCGGVNVDLVRSLNGNSNS